MKLFRNIRELFNKEPSDSEIEKLDRRAFLRGMSVTAAGLLVPLPTILLPVRQDAADFEFGMIGPHTIGSTVIWSNKTCDEIVEEIGRLVLCVGPGGDFAHFRD